MMGTRFHITLYSRDKGAADVAALAAFHYAAALNKVCSDYDVTSELMQLNASTPNQVTPASSILYDVLSRAKEIASLTGGAYDPTLGHHSYNWRMARKHNKLPSREKITFAKSHGGWKNYQLDVQTQGIFKRIPNMRFDLGGIAKGYAADGMLDILKRRGITHVSITAGGELRLGDPPPEKHGWKITIKTLAGEKTLTLSRCAVSTSGDLHQSVTIDGTRYSHIVDPSTGLGLTNRISATIIGKNATLTDALATAYCVNPALAIQGVKTLVITEKPNGTLKITSSANWVPR